MSVWMELRCASRGLDIPRTQQCWSDKNTGPMDLAADDRRSVSMVASQLFHEAKEGGWKRTREGWVCPNCK